VLHGQADIGADKGWVAGVERPLRGSSRRAVIATVAWQAISDRLL
jgi:hypothetical protein